MISVQAHCDLSEALDKMRIRAAGMGESLETVAVTWSIEYAPRDSNPEPAD